MKAKYRLADRCAAIRRFRSGTLQMFRLYGECRSEAFANLLDYLPAARKFAGHIDPLLLAAGSAQTLVHEA